METLGTALLARCAFVLVAGGLGERLGYPDIKLSLPVETTTDEARRSLPGQPSAHCYLLHYCQWIQQITKEEGSGNVPLIIMTSNDTHAKTEALIATLRTAGLIQLQHILLLKQEQVFCFADQDAHLAITQEEGPDGTVTYKLPRKPHGHGDVHSLIYNAKYPAAEGEESKPLLDVLADTFQTRYILFFQDTNAIAPWTAPITLAISEEENLAMNFTCIEREEGEAVGVVCRVKDTNAAGATVWRTAPVEYNIYEDAVKNAQNDKNSALYQLLHSSESSKKGVSPFPGNINTLLFHLDAYRRALQSSKGMVPEFINPKYAKNKDGQLVFKSPARIESLMQDLALCMESTAEEQNTPRDIIGVTVFDRFTFQPVKNNVKDVFAKNEKGEETYGAASGEGKYYALLRRRLQSIGMPLPPEGSYPPVELTYPYSSEYSKPLPVSIFPNIVLNSVCQGDYTLSHLQSQVFPTPEKVKLTAKSTLVLEGKVRVESLTLDGALKITGPSSADSAPLVIRDVEIRGLHWTAECIPADRYKPGCGFADEDLIRGYVLRSTGIHKVDSSTDLSKL
ncbi:UDP-sugar pyrophosphorylase [Angomonas deanei]|nr:UDP-sugar pyrophosphorylase [Angomonas deanei]|eukprot:EPY43103.1 UDP-sugar pyrophosphorylase [Angomonas deanei]